MVIVMAIVMVMGEMRDSVMVMVMSDSMVMVMSDDRVEVGSSRVQQSQQEVNRVVHLCPKEGLECRTWR
jgi:hypothetical protein